MSELAMFNFEQLPVRVVMIDGEPWFVASDVASILGYTNPQKAVRDHCKYAKSLKDIKVNETFTFNEINQLHPQTLLIPESDVYRLVMRSKLPAAERFERWVMEELLPQLRRNKMYPLPSQNQEQSIVDMKSQLLAIKQDLKDQFTEIKQELSSLKTTVSESKQVFPDEAIFQSEFITLILSIFWALHKDHHLSREQLEKLVALFENHLEKQKAVQTPAQKKSGYTTQEKADLKRAAFILQG